MSVNNNSGKLTVDKAVKLLIEKGYEDIKINNPAKQANKYACVRVSIGNLELYKNCKVVSGVKKKGNFVYEVLAYIVGEQDDNNMD